ncbi:MAG: hypothetical protein K5985_04285 [Lachnospiraceae bacterium]|nr:hypothetical protein [Lachnospiraceae bacterium]
MDQKLSVSFDELEKVTGGTELDDSGKPKAEVKKCPMCGVDAVQTPILGGSYKCEECGMTYTPNLSSMQGGKGLEK